ncbi:uncharacterized protein LOC129808851 [Phlebotomus papatasi]|uniref:uncharacterized protein LOC129808851 n=1 Tax=Phlebotomus papatasi TaxID=29031 RepID=UPI002483B503|nr:uncharacterized protein LOC129808851 [Phlebotomus papatasi]
MDAIIAKAQGATHSLSLWATGPSIPYANFSEEKIPEVHVPQSELLNKYDSLTKTVRITAYCLRFIKNCQSAKRVQGELSVLELAEAENKLVKILQAGHYNRELHRLRQNLSLPSTSKILSLNPFLDNDGIMRVGGRLEKSELSFNQKHPILIPHKTHFATLIIRDAHESTIHGGISLTLNYSRNKYWIPNSRNTVKTILDRCVYCFRQKRHTPNQLMGDLPQNRVTPSSPFASCGIDFAGPFYTKASKGRGITKNKGYIAVFVCFSTKAVHLELVSDLSTETFIAALKRFIGRRGKPANIYSDNGTNLVGAKNTLDSELRNATETASKSAAKYATDEGIQWHMIPPAAPHFGGLWEVAVKSTKKHLKALMSDISLTFEEFTTVLTRVEAVLNSRPIAPLSNDPNDLATLSPGHFLIGRQMLAPPEELVQEENPLKKWRTVTRLQQELWKRWSRDYLQQLQQRHKWKQQKEPIKVGELVVMIDENSPPQQWPLARVTEIHPGEDGLPRVADIKTKMD